MSDSDASLVNAKRDENCDLNRQAKPISTHETYQIVSDGQFVLTSSIALDGFDGIISSLLLVVIAARHS